MDRDTYRQQEIDEWSAGDYRPVGRMLEPAARMLVDRSGVGAGDRVLDVATGSGTAAIAAAETGASVVGVDITDAVFDEGRRRAAEGDLDVTLQLGNAEELPFDDDSFDAVISSFGAIMAPDHGAVARELVRVCRPEGTIALTAWPGDGSGTKLFGALMAHAPPPPDFVEPLIGWGDEAHVRGLMEPLGVSLDFEPAGLPIAFPSIDAFEEVWFQNGPMVKTRETLGEMGSWEQAHTEFRAALEAANEAADGTFRMTWDYVIV
ncbi:MAG: methyltransferase domain-containing protein, partial [Nitriliruptorales bacterium]|nr:methyltransferase domain-containing protein [Nitriliruptorales bacterium]